MENGSAQRCERGGVVFYRLPSFAAFPFVRHGFSTRLGGVSAPPFDRMNLSFTRGDDPQAVTENFRRFCAAVEVEADGLVIPYQAHTTNLRYVGAADRGDGFSRPKSLADTDGLFTDQPGVVLCTQYADCVPLLFLDPHKRIIALSHSGWRGTAADMAGETVRRLEKDCGCDPRHLLAGIGPSIGPCCFEVDEPVYRAFAGQGRWSGACFRKDGGGKYHLDLWRINYELLLQAGVTPEHIEVSGLCTRCRPEIFWSHRFTGPTRGSLATVLSLV